MTELKDLKSLVSKTIVYKEKLMSGMILPMHAHIWCLPNSRNSNSVIVF